jgi:hydrogenase expression/formation protein HypC
MCLAVPGKIISITDDEPLTRTGQIDFGGLVKRVNLAFVPEAKIGDYAVVHAGVAISLINQEEADKIFEYIAQLQRRQNGGDTR